MDRLTQFTTWCVQAFVDRCQRSRTVLGTMFFVNAIGIHLSVLAIWRPEWDDVDITELSVTSGILNSMSVNLKVIANCALAISYFMFLMAMAFGDDPNKIARPSLHIPNAVTAKEHRMNMMYVYIRGFITLGILLALMMIDFELFVRHPIKYPIWNAAVHKVLWIFGLFIPCVYEAIVLLVGFAYTVPPYCVALYEENRRRN